MDGATLVARCVAQQGIDVVFGVVGIPVVEVAVAFQSVGVHFVGMRNEQAVSRQTVKWHAGINVFF